MTVRIGVDVVSEATIDEVKVDGDDDDWVLGSCEECVNDGCVHASAQWMEMADGRWLGDLRSLVQ